MMAKNLSDWTCEVNKYSTEWNEKLKNNPATKDLYYGFKVWYSQMVESPEVLFIGINPGSGGHKNLDEGIKSQREHKVDINLHEYFTYMEYLRPGENVDYRLAQQTIEALKIAGVKDFEAFFGKCLKTNYYHIITDNANGIKRVIDTHGKEWAAYNTKCYEQIKRLIEISKPKLIVCEGSSVFNNLKNAYAVISKTPIEITQTQRGIAEGILPNGTHVVGYSRKFSNILNIEGLAAVLKKHIQQT